MMVDAAVGVDPVAAGCLQHPGAVLQVVLLASHGGDRIALKRAVDDAVRGLPVGELNTQLLRVRKAGVPSFAGRRVQGLVHGLEQRHLVRVGVVDALDHAVDTHHGGLGERHGNVSGELGGHLEHVLAGGAPAHAHDQGAGLAGDALVGVSDAEAIVVTAPLDNSKLRAVGADWRRRRAGRLRRGCQPEDGEQDDEQAQRGSHGDGSASFLIREII